MGKIDLKKTKKRESSHWESILFYAWEIDHRSDISTILCDGAVSDGPLKLALNFYLFGEDKWHSAFREFLEIPKEVRG